MQPSGPQGRIFPGEASLGHLCFHLVTFPDKPEPERNGKRLRSFASNMFVSRFKEAFSKQNAGGAGRLALAATEPRKSGGERLRGLPYLPPLHPGASRSIPRRGAARARASPQHPRPGRIPARRSPPLTQMSELLSRPPLALFRSRIQVAFMSQTAPCSPAAAAPPGPACAPSPAAPQLGS